MSTKTYNAIQRITLPIAGVLLVIGTVSLAFV